MIFKKANARHSPEELIWICNKTVARKKKGRKGCCSFKRQQLPSPPMKGINTCSSEGTMIDVRVVQTVQNKTSLL